MTPPLSPEARRRRQKFTVVALASLLIAGGLLILFVLKRVPLPMRIFAGLGDVVAGAVLLVLVRQKLRDGNQR
jgi:hypothetical protein